MRRRKKVGPHWGCAGSISCRLNLIAAASAKPAEYRVSKRHLRGQKSVEPQPGVGSQGYAQLIVRQSSDGSANEPSGLRFPPTLDETASEVHRQSRKSLPGRLCSTVRHIWWRWCIVRLTPLPEGVRLPSLRQYPCFVRKIAHRPSYRKGQRRFSKLPLTKYSSSLSVIAGRERAREPIIAPQLPPCRAPSSRRIAGFLRQSPL